MRDEKDSKRLLSDISHTANSYFYNYNPTKDTQAKHKILQNLRKNKSIAITKPDKGNEFKKLDKDPTKSREASLQTLLRILKKATILKEDEYSFIYPTGTQPACICGLPKLHKSFPPDFCPLLRPIVSSLSTFTIILASF